MGRLSILSVMLLIVLSALILALFLRLREESIFYLGGPILGAVIAAWAYRYDRRALVKGGAIGGLCQGVIALMVFKRGYPFQDIRMMTSPLYLMALAIHTLAGSGIGLLLFLAFKWARPKTAPGRPG